jgi:hypothetical protein
MRLVFMSAAAAAERAAAVERVLPAPDRVDAAAGRAPRVPPEPPDVFFAAGFFAGVFFFVSAKTFSVVPF